MVTHTQIWFGIDALAARCSLSASGLARRAGLDPTTFNRSKRFAAEGAKPRWPSTESIAKALQATGVSFQEFAALADDGPPRERAIPLLSFADASRRGVFDDAGLPVGGAWRELAFPGAPGQPLYALEMTSDALAPLYRAGDRIVVAPGQRLRRGDRVVVKSTSGAVRTAQLGRLAARGLELVALAPSRPAELMDAGDIAWIARVVWSSQ